MFEKLICAAIVVAVVGTASVPKVEDEGHKAPSKKATTSFVAPDEATKRLVDGNRRFVNNDATHPNQTAEHRLALAKGQKPFAVVVTCSDSRVCPEIIFDQGLGDLFVVRVAGNSVGDVELGSIEYAVEHLGAKLILVLGHENCGAVDAAIKGGETHGHIGDVTSPLKPAVDATKGYLGNVLDAAVRHNAKYVADSLRVRDSLFKQNIAKGEVRVFGARYDLDSGLVEILD